MLTMTPCLIAKKCPLPVASETLPVPLGSFGRSLLEPAPQGRFGLWSSGIEIAHHSCERYRWYLSASRFSRQRDAASTPQMSDTLTIYR